MLSRLQLNAGSWLIHTQSSKSLNAASAAAASYCTHKTTMLKIAGPITGTGHKRVIGNALTGGTGTGTCTSTSTCALSLGGALFQPACGVIKWPTNRCLLFSSSRSVEKRSGRSVDGDIISSAADTSNTGQTKFQQVKGSLTEKLKHTAVNGHVDIAKRNTTLDAGFSKDAKELATASDKLQANEIYRSKINKGGKAKKNKLKTEKVDEKPFATINEQQLQVPVMETTVSDMPQAKFSPGERVDRDARPKKKTLETQKTDAKVSAKLQSKSSPRAKVDKAGQPEKKNLKIKETNEKDLDKQSQIAIGDSLMKVTISDKPQAKFGPRERADRDAPPKKKNLKIQKTDAKASGKLQTKSSLRSTVNKAGQPEKKNLKTQKTNEKDLDKQSQVAIGDSLMKLTISDKLQSKSNPRKKGNKADQPKKNNLKTKKNSAKLTQVVSSEMNSGGNKKKLAQDAGERPATNGNARYEDNGSTKLPKADKELLVNTKCGSDNEKEVNQKQKENAPTHAKGKVVVVVESETKAKTIQKYLGDEFVVLASYGHVRDLAPRAGSVRPSEDFIMIWEVPSTAWIHIKKIEEALTGARSLVLASDPDREGEAIAWHIIEVLKQQGSLKKNMIIQRVVFHEVTESAVQNAMLSPRDIYTSLVHARHARSALDYLIGFNISPLLWRKLPGCQSAGRVQSAALSLICDREKEIEKFVPQEYWSVEAKACTRELFLSGRNSAVLAKVTNVNGKKLEKLSINKKTEAEKVALNVSLSNFKVLDVKRINTKKNPPAPYITSTLQRDAANKLKLSATHTMKLAQKLYEGVKISDNEVSGLITYMRTDGLRISEEAAESIRMEVTECYGEDYAVKSIRTFAKKVKNAQEAHEAIRPTDIRRTPSMLASTLEKDLLKLYTLIWCQAMACQMQEAKINQISASFENEEKSVILRSSASAISFPGYLAVFQDNETLITKGEELQEEEEDGSFSYLSELKDKELIAKGEEIQQKPSLASASISLSMASSSSSHDFSAIEPSSTRMKVSESRSLYDVFINHRGPDVKHTLALQLYNYLQQLELRAFLDSEEKQLGVSFPSTIETAIRSASVHIAIFSKGYAESAWCLEELVLMLKSQAKIIPVFDDVIPSDLRHIESGVYANAFARYKEKSRYLDKQLEEWKKALQTLSYIAGEEFYKSHECKDIASAVLKEIERTKSLYFAKYPVGLHNLVQDFENTCLNELVQDFERQCESNVEKKKEAKAKAVGIFGKGGSGKTTLAIELFNRKKKQYGESCFLFDVREASARGKLPSLQKKLVKALFNEDAPKFQCIEQGTSYIRDRIGRSNLLSFLVILDDVDHVQQLDALLIRDLLDKFSNSLVIVTTRDEEVLISTGISTGYNLKRMHRNEARELFCWHAFEQPQPASGYEDIVGDFIDVCGGLPLSLQVLGRHVFRRDLAYWRLQVEEARKTMHKDVLERLKISFDALNREEKEIFMDIACFFIHEDEDMAIQIWKGCHGWNAQRAVQSLKDKCLVTDHLRDLEGWRGFKMHDQLRDLGREIAREINAPRRPWHPQILKSLELKGFQAILSQGNNVRCFQRILDRTMDAKITYFIGNSEEDWNETSASLLWLELDLQGHTHTSIPSWIPLQNLQCLRIRDGHFKRLWQSDVQAPSQLKELRLSQTFVEECPDLSPTSNQLVKFVLNAEGTLMNAWSQLASLRLHPTSLKLNEDTLSGELASNKWGESEILWNFKLISESGMSDLGLEHNTKLKKVSGISPLSKLVTLNILHCPMLEELNLAYLSCLKTITIDGCENLNCLELYCCQNLESVSGMSNLVEFTICQCSKLKELPSVACLSFVERITITECGELQNISLPTSDPAKLVTLIIRECPNLEKLSSLARLSCLERITIDRCEKLQNISGIEELQVLKRMQLSMGSSVVVRNCIQGLKMPSEFMTVIGKAGAESTLNPRRFSSLDIDDRAVCKIPIEQHGNGYVEASLNLLQIMLQPGSFCAIIVCAVVAVENCSRDSVYIGLHGHETMDPWIFEEVVIEGGKWIVTVVITDEELIARYNKYPKFETIEIAMEDPRGIKTGCMLAINKGEEEKIPTVLKTIAKLYEN